MGRLFLNFQNFEIIKFLRCLLYFDTKGPKDNLDLKILIAVPTVSKNIKTECF